ncbi:MAG: beta-eliminating lyase-related protein [Salinisphaera sp.]|nr:beta-eliminating lyase-related protein [Salinisphaera sp.]
MTRYGEEYKYSWHTPGHSGGVAFLKSPVGRAFFEFFGENVLRSDLSVSVPELGSLLEHSGVLGDVEQEAARTFGADRTYFVTNGTSTANKIVWHANVTRGDVVLVDRNCHKSILHAIVMTGAVPIYLPTTRNAYGIIGPIPKAELAPERIAQRIAEHALLGEAQGRVRLAVVTNATYDGLCYDVHSLRDALAGTVDVLHFDEAWFAYARFHPFYTGRFGMSAGESQQGHPITFTTQSTHKLLAAFSQASMVHVRDGDQHTLDPERFNEAFMMHTSTSPQYGIIASLDVASRMMRGAGGTALIEDTLNEALLFRNRFTQVASELEAEDWWFRLWQPEAVEPDAGDTNDIENKVHQSPDPQNWLLDEKASWHGFQGLTQGYVVLDPTKVTVLTPGIADEADLAEWGIPAAVVARFLWNRGLVVEKTGLYSFIRSSSYFRSGSPRANGAACWPSRIDLNQS